MIDLERTTDLNSKNEKLKLKKLRDRIVYEGTYFHDDNGSSQSKSDQSLERSYLAKNNDLRMVSNKNLTFSLVAPPSFAMIYGLGAVPPYGADNLKHDAETLKYMYATRRLRYSRLLCREENAAGRVDMTTFDETFAKLLKLRDVRQRPPYIKQLSKMARCEDDTYSARTERALIFSRQDRCTSSCIQGQYPCMRYIELYRLSANIYPK